MFETGIRQLRMALGMVRGRRLSTKNLANLVQDALATLAEFGEPGADVQQLTDGPFSDPEARDHLATRGIQRTAARLAEQSPFYQRRFTAAGINPRKLTLDELNAIPVTVKSELIERPAEFRCADTTVHLTTRTTGTTGRPAEIWLSRYEIDLWAGLGALSAVLRDELRPTDIMQVHSSSRATAAVQLDVSTCRLAGAGCRVLGIVPADDALDALSGGGSTLLATYPSYLAQLVVAARRRGMGPADFTLRRIQVGGEVLSPSLAQAARAMFGVTALSDSFGMTEVIPVTARGCSHGHLHHDINTGYIEYLDLETGEPAAPGALATVVITPFFPYRDCMPVFRYDTRDVVRMLPDEPMTCEVSGLPGTSHLLGKADHLLRLGKDTVISARELVEAVEALPSEPWPARYRASVHDGRLRLALPVSAVAGLSESGVRDHFASHGLDVAIDVVPDEDAVGLRPLRADLHELTFAARTGA
jgi:phenylacetate-CoA ligase